jgi:predicted nucleotidyltransferase
MINKEEAIVLVKEFINSEIEREEWFNNIKQYIKAFILYGSVAKETNKPDSDIDILIILPLEQEEKYTKGEYLYNYKGSKINIVLRSIEKLRAIALEKTDLIQKEIFTKSEVLIDVDGEVTNLLKEINNI